MGIFLLLATFLSFSACGPEKTVKANFGGTDALQLHWIAGPFVGSLDKNRVRVTLPDGFEDYKVDRAGIYMRIHGHGGEDQDIKITQDQEQERAWIVSNFSFTMTGPWEFIVKAVSLDGLKSESWEVPVQVQ